MLYYLAIFAYILFCWIWSSQPGFDKGKSDFLYWSVFLLFWFTAGWRYETGTDYFAYDELYRTTTTLGEAQQAGGITLIATNTSVYEPHYYSNEEILSLPIRILGKVVELRAKF